jgi:hypothetical protein
MRSAIVRVVATPAIEVVDASLFDNDVGARIVDPDRIAGEEHEPFDILACQAATDSGPDRVGALAYQLDGLALGVDKIDVVAQATPQGVDATNEGVRRIFADTKYQLKIRRFLSSNEHQPSSRWSYLHILSRFLVLGIFKPLNRYGYWFLHVCWRLPAVEQLNFTEARKFPINV